MAAPTVNSNRAVINGGEMGIFGRVSPSDGNITIQTSIKRTGSYAYRVQGASGVKSTWVLSGDDTFTNMTGSFFRGYLYIATLPASTRAIITVSGTTPGTTTPAIRLRSTGILELYDGTSALAASTIALSTGVWYCIEFGTNSTDDVVSLRVNGAVEIDWTAPGGNVPNFSSVVLGAMDTVAATFDLYWDDMAVDALSWCGPGRVVALRPSGAGTSTVAGFTAAGSSPAATKYQSLNEAVTDDAVTYVSTSAVAADRETYTLDDIPADCVAVRGLKFAFKIRRDGASNGSVAITTKMYGHFQNLNTHTSTASFVWFEETNINVASPVATPIGGQWTNERVNALEIGILNSSVNKSDITTLMCELDYDDTPGMYATTDRIYATGFEAGDATADGTVTATAAAATNVARTGTYSLRVNPAGSTASNLSTGTIALSTNRESYTSCYVYVTARPSAGNTMRLLAVRTGTTLEGALRMDSAGKIQLEDRNGLVGSLSSLVIPLNTWTRIDLKVRCSTTTSSNDGAMEVWVNSVSIQSTSTSNSNDTSWQNVAFGTTLAPGVGGCDVNYDDCVIDTTYWVNPIDDIHVVDLVPTAAGGLTGTGFSANGAANQWDCLDETPSNGDTDYVGTGTTNLSRGSYATQDITASAGAVRSVTVVGSFKRDSVNGIVTPGVRTNTHTFKTTTTTTTAAYAWTRNQLKATDQDGAWTSALVNSSELGILNQSVNASRCSNLRASVEYALAGAAGPGGMVPQMAVVGF